MSDKQKSDILHTRLRKGIRHLSRAIDLAADLEFGDMEDEWKQEYDAAMQQVLVDGMYLQHLPSYWQNENQIVEAAVSQDHRALQFASARLRSNFDFLHQLVSDEIVPTQYILQNIPDNADRQLMEQIAQNWGALGLMQHKFRKDPDIVIAACEGDWEQAQYMADELKGNPQFIFELVTRFHGGVFKWANERVRKNKDIALKAVEEDGTQLEHAGTNLQGDKDVVKAAVSQNGSSLRWAAEHLRRDYDIVMAAVSQDVREISGSVLEFAHEDLRDSWSIAKEAIRSDAGAMEHVSPRIRNFIRTNRDCALQMAQINGLILKWLDEFKDDYGIVHAAITNDQHAFMYASEKLKDNWDIFITTFGNGIPYETLMRYVGPTIISEMTTDYNVALNMVKMNGNLVKYVGKFMHDINIAMAAVQQSKSAFYFLPAPIQKNGTIRACFRS